LASGRGAPDFTTSIFITRFSSSVWCAQPQQCGDWQVGQKAKGTILLRASLA
jgi:hypothetical protein